MPRPIRHMMASMPRLATKSAFFIIRSCSFWSSDETHFSSISCSPSRAQARRFPPHLRQVPGRSMDSNRATRKRRMPWHRKQHSTARSLVRRPRRRSRRAALSQLGKSISSWVRLESPNGPCAVISSESTPDWSPRSTSVAPFTSMRSWKSFESTSSMTTVPRYLRSRAWRLMRRGSTPWRKMPKILATCANRHLT